MFFKLSQVMGASRYELRVRVYRLGERKDSDGKAFGPELSQGTLRYGGWECQFFSQPQC